MTTQTDHDEDRPSRRRRYYVVFLAVIVILLQNAFNIVPELEPQLAPLGARLLENGLAGAFWLAVLYLVTTVSGVGRRGDAALNDELSAAHRTTALTAGYWCMLAGLAGVFALSVWGRHEFTLAYVRHLVTVIAGVGAVIPAMVFAILERRAERLG